MKILVAKDEAFNFIYRANIDALKSLGEVAYFSPLHDDALPECDFLYLPGGYPELFVEGLAANRSMLQSIKQYADKGGRIYAECGGFMYLTRSIDDVPMCGVLPLDATMENAHLHLGYRQMLVDGHLYKGHEFHYSSIKEGKIPDGVLMIQNQCSARGTKVPTAIYKYRNVVAGYTHWYWAEHPDYLMSL